MAISRSIGRRSQPANTSRPKRIRSSEKSRGRNAGFTLVELLIVVVIVGILAAIAVPVYTGYVAKSRQRAMWGALMALAQTEEMYRLRWGRYTDTMSQLTAIGWVNTAHTDATHLYSISFPVAATATAFTAQASGNIDGDVTNDVWQISESCTLIKVTDDLTN
jgi:type IV pilus assembly protein PilE